jgi:hypothetical protein
LVIYEQKNMTPIEFYHRMMHPGLTRLHELGGPAVIPEANRILIAIAMQESGDFRSRYQVLNTGNAGAARGWWGFEKGGGVHGVMTHQATRELARRLCEDCAIHWDLGAIWRALEGHDPLAVGFSRLLLWSDPHPLPVTADAAWECYRSRLWRPGKPHPDEWPRRWAAADAAVRDQVAQSAPSLA